MNKFFIALLTTLSLMCGGCKGDDKGPKPTSLDQSTFVATSSPGKVVIKWVVPDGANYKYVRLTYTNPDSKQIVTRLASVYADSIVIEGLLSRYGAINFKLQPVSKKGVEGDSYSITAQAEPLPKVTKIITGEIKRMTLADGADDLFVSHPESSEGPKANLIDGNNSSFYHENWSSSPQQPFPHYIVMKMPEELKAFNFYLKNRDNSGRNNPTKIDVWVSDTFDGTTFNPESASAVKVQSLSGLPEGQAAEYTSPSVILQKKYRYIWFEIKASRSGNFIALAELHVNKFNTEVFDPETDQTTKEE